MVLSIRLLQHPDLIDLLQQAQKTGQKTLITVQHDIEEIHQVLTRVKRDGEHQWWESLFGWSPTATGLFNSMFHPVMIFLILILICLLLIIVLYIKVWRMVKQITQLQKYPRVYTIPK